MSLRSRTCVVPDFLTIDEMQRLTVSGCRWAVPGDSDPGTGRLAGAAGVQYALRIRNACLVAAAFAGAGITAIVTGTIISEGLESLIEVLGGRLVNFIVLRPPVAVLRRRGIDRLPGEAAYLADRYGDADHPGAAQFAGRVQAAADGRAEAAWMAGAAAPVTSQPGKP